jgi:hypothetical protein
VRISSGSFKSRRKIRDRRAILADGARDVLLLQVKFVGEPPVGEGLFNRVEVLALDVLDQGHLQERSFLSRRDITDGDRHAQQAGELGGAPAPFAGDDLEPIAHPPHHDGLDDAVALDRLRQLLEPGLVDVPRGWNSFGVRRSISVSTVAVGRGWRQIRNQRAEAFTECGTFFHGDHVERRAREDRKERLGFAVFADCAFIVVSADCSRGSLEDFARERAIGFGAARLGVVEDDGMPWLGASPSRTFAE